MSLVAAYSDSDSDSEGGDNPDDGHEEPMSHDAKYMSDQNKLNKEASDLFGIDDEDEWESTAVYDNKHLAKHNESTQELFSQLPQPKEKNSNIIEETDDEFIKKKPNLLAEQQQPKVSSAEDNKSGESSKTDEKPLKRGLLNLPKPSKDVKKKQTVKISIPTLEEIGADSDSDDDEKSKPNRIIRKKSTLFSILPKPHHSVTVGENRNKVFQKQSNRVLMPHTLTKRKEEPVKVQQNKNKHTGKVNSLVSEQENSDGDEEDEGISENFFSLGDMSKITADGSIQNSDQDKCIVTDVKTESTTTAISLKNNLKPQKSSSNENHTVNTDTAKTSTTKSNVFFANLFRSNASSEKISTDKTSSSSKPQCKKTNANIMRKVDSHNVTRPYTDDTKNNCVTAPYAVIGTYSSVTRPYSETSSNVTAPYGSLTRPYGDTPYCDVTAPHGSVIGPYSKTESSSTNSHSYPPSQSFFSYAYQDTGTADQDTGTADQDAEHKSDADYYNQPNEDLPIDKTALQALQGRKRKKEEINLIDINADDIQGNSDEYLKTLTVESSYQSKKPKDDQPSSKEKRKHQITYLAFQAKEREFELRQAWAEGLASKRQTQSKYGF